ncbi:MAG TPA: TIGR01777 family protein [Bacteroidales bacterium]|nr:TIGR01777 family protein [Bacteroidales bacterium]
MSDKSKTVIIIGGTGLLGRQIVHKFQKLDYRVLVLTRNPLKAKKFFSTTVDFLYWDGEDMESLKEVLNSTKAVINLSGESIAKRWTQKNKELILKSRVDTTNTVVQAINRCSAPPEVFIQASAIGFYSCNSSDPVDEDNSRGDGFLSKIVSQWEQASYSVDSKVRLVIIRTGVVLSSEGGFIKEILPAIKSFAGSWFGSGEQKVSWIHIQDHANAVSFLLNNSNCKGVYNLVSSNPVVMKLLLKKIGKTINRPVWLSIPSFFLQIIFGEMANEVLLANQAVLPRRLIEAGFKFDFEDIDSALKDLLI